MNLHHYKLVQNLRRWARASGLVGLLNRFRRHTSYEAAFSAALRSAIKPGDVVWDVGANVGLYTLQFADWASPGGSVVAFEPLPSALQELKKVIASSGSRDRIHVVAAALSDAPGTATFTSSTTTDASGQSVPTTAHLSDHPSGPEGEGISVPVSTVDLMAGTPGITLPTVTKIDVEGFEEEVLLGGAATFSGAQSRHVFIEVHFARLDERNRGDAPARMVRLLKDWGYRVRWADPSHLHASRSAS